MSAGYELKVEQSQKLSMTPGLIQAIRILEYDIEELNEYIQKELLENPLLEAIPEEVNHDVDDFGKWNNLDNHDDFSIDRYGSFRYGLTEYLLLQLKASGLDSEQTEIGIFLIHNIDENGYLTITLKEAADSLFINEDEVEDVLRIIQTFDPAGVGAMDMSQCLILQLERRNLLTKELASFIENHMEDIALNKYASLAKKNKMSREEVQSMVDLIKTLNPKPGRLIEKENNVRYIVPDIILDKGDEGYKTSAFKGGIPKLMVSSYYDSIKNERQNDKELDDYLKERLNSAQLLIRSIEQRQSTISKVADAIVNHQSEYFDKGVEFLKPLTLKTISSELGIHESTVSRAVKGKYIDTHKGLLPLKFFFTGGLISGGGSVSTESVKAYIKEIVSGEDSKKPLSDLKICDMLQDKGIEISRRTIAKYREELGIPSSQGRRRF